MCHETVSFKQSKLTMFKMTVKETDGQKAALWSNEEVQTFLCTVAEEQIQMKQNEVIRIAKVGC